MVEPRPRTLRGSWPLQLSSFGFDVPGCYALPLVWYFPLAWWTLHPSLVDLCPCWSGCRVLHGFCALPIQEVASAQLRCSSAKSARIKTQKVQSQWTCFDPLGHGVVLSVLPHWGGSQTWARLDSLCCQSQWPEYPCVWFC